MRTFLQQRSGRSTSEVHLHIFFFGQLVFGVVLVVRRQRASGSSGAGRSLLAEGGVSGADGPAQSGGAARTAAVYLH